MTHWVQLPTIQAAIVLAGVLRVASASPATEHHTKLYFSRYCQTNMVVFVCAEECMPQGSENVMEQAHLDEVARVHDAFYRDNVHEHSKPACSEAYPEAG